MSRQRNTSQSAGPARAPTPAPERTGTRRVIDMMTFGLSRPRTPAPGPAQPSPTASSHARARTMSTVAGPPARPNTGMNGQSSMPSNSALVPRSITTADIQLYQPHLVERNVQPQNTQRWPSIPSQPDPRPPSNPPTQHQGKTGQGPHVQTRAYSEHATGSRSHGHTKQDSDTLPPVPPLPAFVRSRKRPPTADDIPPEVWGRILDLGVMHNLVTRDLCQLAATSRYLRAVVKPYIYRGVDFFWARDGTVIQHRRGKTLPARNFAFNSALYLGETMVGNFPESGITAEPPTHLYNTFKALQGLALRHSNITRWLLETIIQFDNLVDLRIEHCGISSTAVESLFRTRTNWTFHMKLESLALLRLRCHYQGGESPQAHEWATRETFSLLTALVGPKLENVEIEFPTVLVTGLEGNVRGEGLSPFQVSSLMAALPTSVQKLRIQSWGRESIEALGVHLPRLYRLRVLLLDGFTMDSEGWQPFRPGALPRLTHFLGPEVALEWILPGTPPLKEICLCMPSWRDDFPGSQAAADQARRRQRAERMRTIEWLFTHLWRLDNRIFYLACNDGTSNYQRILDKKIFDENEFFTSYELRSVPRIWGRQAKPKYVHFQPLNGARPIHPWIHGLLSRAPPAQSLRSMTEIYGNRDRRRPVQVEPLDLNNPLVR